jgi:flagellin-like hook-associated protein FlgL
MTRINTNVSSLIGRNNLGRANANLSQALTRLSTGLRINTGKDDPAGLIASENLRSDITAIKKAIGNTDRANQVIATADSALGQVSSLLNDIRGLVTESANAGALSDEQIAANQLQVDSSLEALNRIAQTTTFQGRRLLDGSLDFIKSAGTNFSSLSGLQIDQANLGAAGQVDVEVAVSAAATKASIEVDNIDPVVPGVASTGTISFADGALTGSASIALPIETTAAVAGTGSLAFTVETAASTQAQGSFQTNATGTLTVDGQTINIVADAAGAAGNATITSVVINGGAGSNNSSIAAGVLTINVTTAIDTTATVADIVTAINNGADGAAGGDDIYTASTTGGATTVTTAGVTGATATNIAGGGTISLDSVDNNLADGTEGNGAKTLTVQYGQAQNNAVYTPGTDTLVVNVTAAEGTATLADIVTSINNGADGVSTGSDNDFTATLDAGSGAIRTAAFPANFSLTDQAGVNATTTTRTISLTTNEDGDQDFDIQILSAAAADIDDTDPSDGITASISGNKDTGYTVTIANDAVVDLDNLATFLQTNIAELDTATINGSAANDLDLRTSLAAAPSGQQVVAGSQAQVTNTQAITVTGATANIGLSFVRGTVVGTGTLADRVAVSGDATNGYVVTIDDSEAVTFGDISDALETIAEIGAGGSSTVTPATVFDTSAFDPSVGNTTVAGARTAGSDVITITATEESPEFDGTISFNTTNPTTGAISAAVDDDGNITISVDATSSYSMAQIVSAINDIEGYSAELTSDEGSGFFDANDITESTAPTFTALTGGVARTGGLAADAVVQLTGTQGSEVFNLKAGTDIQTLVDQINLVSDATGVEASIGEDGTTLLIESTGYGSKAIVDLKVSSEGAGGTFTASVGSGARSEGTDIEATINGIAATGDGNSLSINTATLDLSTTVEAGFTGTAAFSITGGGALFQLGPDVVSNQQARLGIASVNTAALGGVSGKLYQLGSGGTADLAKDPTTAARVVEEAINQVTSLRGRLGAFQRTSLETNKNALNDTLSNLTEAESTIRDADFAEETANLTRSQILVQSGTRVLAIANQNPQNVLALLG